jgi:lipopolysaccharide transport system ATP-binding protein
MSKVIEVNGLGKQYRIGRKEKKQHDTFIGSVRDILLSPFRNYRDIRNMTKLENDHESVFWALQDVSFDVQEGQVLGIIGRNGAGKSTLLKIISRITDPTTGEIKIKGRISSLLEVGTGFHPDLSGRDNVFMNGTILGMTRKEIERKFDEIVSFSGVEKFIDTPVKFYSSGMKVRLGFAVAAHLEPEILIVDEVLAVGDAEFQKKCLGKMKDVTGAGRTVLFVSHNMTAMNSLCDQVLYLKEGKLEKLGATASVINYYLSKGSEISTRRNWDIEDAPGDDAVRLLGVRLVNTSFEDIDMVDFYEPWGVEVTYQVLKDGYLPLPNLHLFNDRGDYVCASTQPASYAEPNRGIFKSVAWVPGHLINDGRYMLGIACTTMIPQKIHFYEKESLIFDIIEDMNKRKTDYRGPMPGVIRPELNWRIEKLN